MVDTNSKSTVVDKRMEILFLYDVTNSNPNGDPIEENKPRIDEDTHINLVTDVRLKRTIRDYLHEIEGHEIFVRQIHDQDGYLQDAKARARDFLKTAKVKSDASFEELRKLIQEAILSSAIDVRLFGATIPIELKVKEKSKKGKKDKEEEKEEDKPKKGSITLTGPVQFSIGRSLHTVRVMFIKGTGAFASTEGKRQQSFREEWIVPYSLIGFYGIINEVRAKETSLTTRDVDALFRGLWWGTNNLITRSKIGHAPRLLLVIEYKEKYFHVGDLLRRISLKHDLAADEEIRSIEDVKIDVTSLVKTLLEYKDLIETVRVLSDASVTYIWDDNGTQADFKNLVDFLTEKGIPAEELTLLRPAEVIKA